MVVVRSQAHIHLDLRKLVNNYCAKQRGLTCNHHTMALYAHEETNMQYKLMAAYMAGLIADYDKWIPGKDTEGRLVNFKGSALVKRSIFGAFHDAWLDLDMSYAIVTKLMAKVEKLAIQEYHKATSDLGHYECITILKQIAKGK